MLIDCYGYTNTDIGYQHRKKHFAESIKIGNYMYIRFGVDSSGAIHRVDITDADNPRIRWAYGAWENKENLTYIHDLNTPIEIN